MAEAILGAVTTLLEVCPILGRLVIQYNIELFCVTNLSKQGSGLGETLFTPGPWLLVIAPTCRFQWHCTKCLQALPTGVHCTGLRNEMLSASCTFSMSGLHKAQKYPPAYILPSYNPHQTPSSSVAILLAAPSTAHGCMLRVMY